jgi:hypothetical protein
VKTGTLQTTLYLLHTCSYIHTFGIYYPLWVKVGLRNVHTTLPSICEVREKWQMEGNNFLVVVNEITFKPVP